jgi:hypothetical protein
MSVRLTNPFQYGAPWLLMAVVAQLLVLIGCSKLDVRHAASNGGSQSFTNAVESVLRIDLLSNGALLVNGTPTSVTDLRGKLDRLRSENGEIVYCREPNKGGEPPRIAAEVVSVILDSKLPMRVVNSSEPQL